METYILAPEALQDIQDVWDFIAIDNPEAATRVQEERFEAFEGLVRMPGKGHQRRDLTDKRVLFFNVRSYLVVYRPDTTPLQIVGILPGARDIPSLLRER